MLQVGWIMHAKLLSSGGGEEYQVNTGTNTVSAKLVWGRAIKKIIHHKKLGINRARAG